MNIKSMRIRSYRSFAVDEHVPPEAAERYRTLKAHERLRAAGCNEIGALRHVGISRRTLYRWRAALAAGGQRGLAPKSTRPRRPRSRCWTPRDVRAVMDMRRKYPFMGKERLQRMLLRKGVRLSVSTVGRIIERGLARGVIRRASACEGRLKPKRRRSFAKWARRWKYGSRARAAGELVQIDHMTYLRDGQAIKEFRAICPVTRFMTTRVYSRATAGNARRFLMDLLAAVPFPLLSIQVDGGSEFMAQFEDACEQLRIARLQNPKRVSCRLGGRLVLSAKGREPVHQLEILQVMAHGGPVPHFSCDPLVQSWFGARMYRQGDTAWVRPA